MGMDIPDYPLYPGVRLRLSRSNFERLTAEARARAPHEACGLIAGTDEDGAISIREVFMLTNTDHNSEHFTIDPREQLQAVKRMRELGLRPLGNWHSHPATPARPSQEDIRLAYDRQAIYCILSLAASEPDLRAYHIEDGTVTRFELDILP